MDNLPNRPPNMRRRGASLTLTASPVSPSTESSSVSNHDSLGNLPLKPSLIVKETDNPRRSHNNDGLDPNNLPQIPKRTSISFSDRSVSTSLRLRRQGLRSSNRVNFAVRSIRRGSEEWSGILKPFVADLAFRSVEYRRSHSEVSFRPFTCQASVLFVDLSSYSAITRLISHRGAHALSSIVNSYFSRLLTIVRKYGGDVCKFAGDAVLCVWDGSESDLELNNQTAVLCAMEMQEKAGWHEVDGTPLSFRIHAGVCCGLLESEIFVAPSNVHMQRLYHSVGGESLTKLGEAVNYAGPGEVCVTSEVARSLGSHATMRPLTGRDEFSIVEEYRADTVLMDKIETKIEKTVGDRMIRRSHTIEEDFIHPSVLRLLGHGGLSPTQIAQMRSLCVLFIAKTSNSSTTNWLMEVSSVCDHQRCPSEYPHRVHSFSLNLHNSAVVQIVDDDKAVHVVAAVNLYEAVPESALKGIDICSQLVAKQTGCAIGMACGPTFCGVTGCASIACRWDITGPPAVRAARLMQFTLSEGIEVAIDQSVYNSPTASTRLSILEQEVRLKGTETTVPVYVLSQSDQIAAFRVLESIHGRVHDEQVQRIVSHIGDKVRCAALITGPQFAGKKIVAQRAAGFAGFVPYLHISDESGGFLQLARTIAIWFHYADVPDIDTLARAVLRHLDKGRWSRAHDDCVALVDMALAHGLRACFVIDRVQFLDDFSVSVLRECLQPRVKGDRRNPSLKASGLPPTLQLSDSDHQAQICFLCVHGAFYHWRSGLEIVEDITRSMPGLSIPIIEVCEATRDELRTVVVDLIDVDVNDRFLESFNDTSGGCVGYCIEKAAALRNESGIMWKEGKHGYTQLTKSLIMTVTPGKIKSIHQFGVHRVSTDVAMKFSQTFDELPPIMQTICKALALSAQTGFYKLSRFLMWETLNDLIADGVELDNFGTMIQEMVDLFILKCEGSNGEEVLCFQCPAMADTALAVSTPIQVKSITEALIDRLEPQMAEGDFRIPFVIANLTLRLVADANERVQEYEEAVVHAWQEGYRLFNIHSVSWEEDERRKWKERFDDELTESRLEVTSSSVFGEHFCLQCWASTAVDPHLALLKLYSAPISLGPMGHTLMVLCRNLFHSYGSFHGYEQSRAEKIEQDISSASSRYLREVLVLEDYLSLHGYPATPKLLESEVAIISDISKPSLTDDEVLRKASAFLDCVAAEMVENRSQRLHKLVEHLRSEEVPEVVLRADTPIQRAYKAFRAEKDPSERAQDALCYLAASHWQPSLPPEFLPLTTIHTVARIRNRCFRRLTGTELLTFKHQQSHLTFEAFLVVTPLLEENFEYRKLSMNSLFDECEWGTTP